MNQKISVDFLPGRGLVDSCDAWGIAYEGGKLCLITCYHSKDSSATCCPGCVTTVIGKASVGISVVVGMIALAG